ncbi:DUF4252 domain-containing protein [Flavobacterium sp. ZT3R18]|uniref:DUF4252 domain-containing protein n=1 Tax=Flavobacterium sp. ZT3R18 TaxID=2594429 RepID=UPI00117AD38E|nr:DUF4252 domain-containing protein [Flavobacterium sp. ZT3R18]TRX38766.1 DUF4252 domain-containing protein [Flavobacterium sp. ZT3R18]
MKNLIVLSLVCLLVSCGAKTPYEAFRKENKKDVALSFGASRFVVNALIRDKEFRNFTQQSGVKKYHILVAKENPEFLKSNFGGFLKNNNFEEVFHSNTSDGKIYIYSCEKGDKLKEVIVKIEGGSQMVLLSVQGDLKINDFEKLTAFNDLN